MWIYMTSHLHSAKWLPYKVCIRILFINCNTFISVCMYNVNYQFFSFSQVVDLSVNHPSCSGQHAALQFRQVEHHGTDGMLRMKVK